MDINTKRVNRIAANAATIILIAALIVFIRQMVG